MWNKKINRFYFQIAVELVIKQWFYIVSLITQHMAHIILPSFTQLQNPFLWGKKAVKYYWLSWTWNGCFCLLGTKGGFWCLHEQQSRTHLRYLRLATNCLELFLGLLLVQSRNGRKRPRPPPFWLVEGGHNTLSLLLPYYWSPYWPPLSLPLESHLSLAEGVT